MAARKGNGKRSGRRSAAKRPTKAELARLEKETRREKSRSIAKRIFVAVLIVVLVAILGFAGFGIAYFVTDGFGGKVPTAIVMIEDKIYTDSADGAEIYPGDEIRVQSLTGATEYVVKIEATAESGDFSFTVGAEPYTWHDLAGRDMTKGFMLEKTDTGFTVKYDSLSAIVGAVLGADIEIAEGADLTGDLFVLVITIDETEYRIGFGIGLPVTDIAVNPDHIVINADRYQ